MIWLAAFVFGSGFGCGFLVAQWSAATRWFNERAAAERQRRVHVEEVRERWRQYHGERDDLDQNFDRLIG